ncbi:hypothetical protein GIG_02216 [Mycoplasmopsis anatis 1340]|uniref:Uncharacterized protein n=1 Tax=Mycoplasmopsis anatis 1340 TaxID=1034808 RepID=F9QDD6_9BACT|nr:hypothetical protein GIG_02216 [Mycoplasmopsis anatis 1340]
MNTTIETINKKEIFEDYKKFKSIEDNMKGTLVGTNDNKW